MSLLVTVKQLPESRILTSYFTVQLMNYIIMHFKINCTANYIHYNIGYVIIHIMIYIFIPGIFLQSGKLPISSIFAFCNFLDTT